MKPDNYKQTIPFFVVDRPMSLNLLDYCDIYKREEFYGLMTHANTSRNFQKLFREIKHDNIVKACDSGVFTKNGCMMDYSDLFKIYEEMEVDYGIMIDFLNDKEKTIESAARAMKEYEKKDRCFNLVGVAQGNDIEEYLDCYAELKSLGFKDIAVGGLLKKTENSARYVKVKDENFLKDVIQAINNDFNPEWLFALGCYHPKRHRLFNDLGVFGADYKGWILNYKTPNVWLNEIRLELIELEERILNYQDNFKKNSEFILDDYLNSVISEYFKRFKTYKKFSLMDNNKKRDYRFMQIYSYFYNNIFSLFQDYLLIISCSQKKSDIDNPAPAIKLYDGPFFKMIRKMKEERDLPENMQVIIISAKYGAIGLYDLIEKYDQRLNKNNYNESKKKINSSIKKLLANNEYNEIFLGLGKEYRSTLNELNFNTNVISDNYRIGKKLSRTKKWIISKNNNPK